MSSILPHRAMTTVFNRTRHFFFNDTATTEIYTLSLHDALPIFVTPEGVEGEVPAAGAPFGDTAGDRKSTRLNSSHDQISYAVFCLKKKTKDKDGKPATVTYLRSQVNTSPANVRDEI